MTDVTPSEDGNVVSPVVEVPASPPPTPEVAAAVQRHETAVSVLESAKAQCEAAGCGSENDVPATLEAAEDPTDVHRFGAIHLSHASELEAAYRELAESSRARVRAEAVAAAQAVLKRYGSA